MLTLSGESGQTAIQRNAISDIPTLGFPQVHITEGGREEEEEKKVEQCDLESGRGEFGLRLFTGLLRYELNMRNVNLSMCGHGAFLFCFL